MGQVNLRAGQCSRPFTSTFVEQMEVLGDRKKIEVELITFSGSINSKTPRKTILARRECVCRSVRKSSSENIVRKSRLIWTKFSVNVAITLVSRCHYGQSNISQKFGEEADFGISLHH